MLAMRAHTQMGAHSYQIKLTDRELAGGLSNALAPASIAGDLFSTGGYPTRRLNALSISSAAPCAYCAFAQLQWCSNINPPTACAHSSSLQTPIFPAAAITAIRACSNWKIRSVVTLTHSIGNEPLAYQYINVPPTAGAQRSSAQTALACARARMSGQSRTAARAARMPRTAAPPSTTALASKVA